VNRELRPLTVRFGERTDYSRVWQAMREFTQGRDAGSTDELWTVEHLPVYTLGQAGHADHILNPGDIPVVRSDRGGQVTYHGPGQLVAYTLLDIKRRRLGVRELVHGLEQCVVNLLGTEAIEGERVCGAPGVYVAGRKVAALGLRVRRGCTYHGMSLNVDMSLSPYAGINPCGHQGLEVSQLRDLGFEWSLATCARRWVGEFARHFGYQVDVGADLPFEVGPVDTVG